MDRIALLHFSSRSFRAFAILLDVLLFFMVLFSTSHFFSDAFLRNVSGWTGAPVKLTRSILLPLPGYGKHAALAARAILRLTQDLQNHA